MVEKQNPGSNAEHQDLVEPDPTSTGSQFGAVDMNRIFRSTETLLGGDGSPNFERSGNLSTSEKNESKSEGAPEQRKAVSDKKQSFLALLALILGLTLSPFTVFLGYLAVRHIRLNERRGEMLAWISVGLGWLVFAGWVVLLSSLTIVWVQI